VAAPNPIGEFIKFLLLQNLKKCSGCRRPNDPSNSDFGDWAVKTLPPFAIVIGAKCPACQPPDERAEVAIRQASGTMYKLDGVRLVEQPKTNGGDDGGGPQARAS
jgi:hypothetical protein